MTARATSKLAVGDARPGLLGGLAARFALALFVSATLLFACQPMTVRIIVPLFGGSPSVWIVSSLCFQATLLAGYCYAHVVGSRLSVRAQVTLQLALVAAAFLVLPVRVDAELARSWTTHHPSLGLIVLLLRAVGLPFFVLSTTSPLLQRWFAETGERDPYHLYAASNAGSMLALVGYPFLVEPLLSVSGQGRALHAGYALYAVLVVVCAGAAVRRPRGATRVEATPLPPGVTWAEGEAPAPPSVPSPAPSTGRLRARLGWVALGFVPSSLLLGATEYVTTTVASVPLLWLIPLALYLASFIVAFARRRFVPEAWVSRAVLALALIVAALSVFERTSPAWIVASLHMALLFVASVGCHQALAARRPHASRLTEFYLLLSFGGVLGGIFNGLVAPHVFDELFEYPIAIAMACLARVAMRDPAPTGATWASSRRPIAFAIALGGIMLALAAKSPLPGEVLFQDRTFFGVLRVVRDRARGVTELAYGRGLVGEQSVAAEARRVPVGDYGPGGPAGLVLRGGGEARRVGVIGLGAGALASYARAGDAWTFFEKDAALVEVARRYFTFLDDARASARVAVEIGDARLLLRDGAAARFDVLVFDAAAAGALPLHLTTREALAVYRRALEPNGVLLVHVALAHLDLEPVFAALARDAGWSALARSPWIAMARSDADLAAAGVSAPSWGAPAPSGASPWTDDFADVLGAMRF